jgi:hypothetical protein
MPFWDSAATASRGRLGDSMLYPFTRNCETDICELGPLPQGALYCDRPRGLASPRDPNVVFVLRETFESAEPLILWRSRRSQNLPILRRVKAVRAMIESRPSIFGTHDGDGML